MPLQSPCDYYVISVLVYEPSSSVCFSLLLTSLMFNRFVHALCLYLFPNSIYLYGCDSTSGVCNSGGLGKIRNFRWKMFDNMCVPLHMVRPIQPPNSAQAGTHEPSLTADTDGRQWRPSVSAAFFDGRHWRYVCTGNRQWRPTNLAIFSKNSGHDLLIYFFL